MAAFLKWIALASLLFLASGGAVKGFGPFSEFLGIDTTLIAGLIVVCAVVAVHCKSPLERRHLLLLGLFGASLLPGVVLGWSTGGGDYFWRKVTVGLPLMMLSLLGGMALLRTTVWQRRWVYLTAVYCVLVGAMALLNPDEGVARSTDSLALAGSNTISLGRIAGATFVSFLLLAWLERSRRLRWIGVAAVAAVLLVLSGSRGPLLASVLALVVVWALVRRSKAVGRRPIRGRRPWVGVLGGVLAIVAVAVTVWAGLVPARLTDFADASTSARTTLWTSTTNILLQQPWGVGWGQLHEHLPAEAALIGVGEWQYPHNMLLEFGVEGGVLALGAVIYLLWCAWLGQSAGFNDPMDAVFLGLFVFFVANAMVSGDQQDNRHLWVVVGACLAGATKFPGVRRNGSLSSY